MSFANDLAISLLPIGLLIGGQRLKARDSNTTGADDAFGQVMLDLAPIAPELVSGGQANSNATDKAMLAIYRTAEAYLKTRGKLPGQEPPPLAPAGSTG